MSSPINKTRIGTISVTTWENQTKNDKGEPTTFLTHTTSNSYKDKNDEWKDSNNYKTTELPKLILALQKEYEKAMLKNNE